MKEFNYTIKDDVGIHARPAGLLVKEAEKFKSEIEIRTQTGKSADAKRLFPLMSLGVKTGDTITVLIAGKDEAEACTSIQAFLEENL